MGKVSPMFGLLFNYIKYRKIHFQIGSFVEIINQGFFKYGKNLKIGESSRLHILHDCNLIIGDNVSISRNCYIYPESIFIGNKVSVQDNVRIYGNVTIGNYVIIAPNVFISSGTHVFDKEHITILEQDNKYKIDFPVIIEDDVWIGINSVILPGVIVAKGCIIGAGSILTKSTKPYEIWGGVPAKKIKKRYKE